MQEWKIRQTVYHRLNHEHDDDLKTKKIVIKDNIKEYAFDHFYKRIDEWIYPAKSYFVAYCYAYWISRDFDEDFWELLKDPDLLYGNDPYFKPYSDETAEIYDYLFDMIDWPIPMKGMVPDVYEYYKKEILNHN